MANDLTIRNGRILGSEGAIAVHIAGRRVAPGLDADLVILDRDLREAGPSAIIGTTVRATVLGGRLVYRSEGLA